MGAIKRAITGGGTKSEEVEKKRAQDAQKAAAEASATRSANEARIRSENAQARSKQFDIAASRDIEKAEQLSAQQELSSGRSARAQTARNRFRRARSRQSTVLTGASGPSSRASVRRRQLFSVLGEGGARA